MGNRVENNYIQNFKVRYDKKEIIEFYIKVTRKGPERLLSKQNKIPLFTH